MRREESEIVKLDMNTYSNRLNERVDKFILENNLSGNEEFIGHVNVLKEAVIGIVKSDLQVINLHELSKSSAMIKLSSISYILNNNKIIVSLVAVILLLSASMCLIWKRRKMRRIAWIGYSFMASGIAVMLVGISGCISGFYNYIAIDIDYLAECMAAIIKGYLISLTQLGGYVFGIGILLMVVYWRYLIKKYNSEDMKMGA